MFIATALVVSHPDRFNVRTVEPGPAFAFHRAPVLGMHPLSRIAELAGTSTETIRALNPELVRNSLPPSRSAYHVRIPAGTYDTFAQAYEALPDHLKKATTEHRIRQGETLSEIAAKYGTSVSRLMQQNGLTSTRIRAGRSLAVPVADYAPSSSPDALLAAADVEGSLVHYGSRNLRPIVAAPRVELELPTQPAKTTSARSTPPKTRRVSHRVKRGDTLSEIAAKYQVSVSALKSWNKLRSSKIRIGQVLTVYVSDSSRIVHTVRRGETLTKIAGRYQVSVADLRSWNGLKGSRIYAGQKLAVYGKG
jgi:membrane-bound lytic murein transglycosylase D